MCSGSNRNACVQLVYCLVNQQNNLKETLKDYIANKADGCIFCLFFFFPFLFSEWRAGRIFEESSCWNCAAVCASCALFHIPVVQNGLCSAHPNHRKVVSLSFFTVFIYKRVLFLIPNDALSWKVGVWVGCVGHSSAKTTFFVA